MAAPNGVCLVARAVPMSANKIDDADSLAAQLDATLLLGAKKAEPKEEKVVKLNGDRKKRVETVISPADHLALQSLRSSALARKTNTTTKFSKDCRNLFADLLLGDADEPKTGEKSSKGEKKGEVEEKVTKKEEKKETKREEKKGKEEKSEDAELIARGPIRAPVVGHMTFHPYSLAASTGSPNATAQTPFNATAPHSAVYDQSSYNPMAAVGYGYECGLPSNWSCGGWSAGRDSVLSSPSATPDTTYVMSPGGQSERSELPDDLSDFILEYSRRYSPTLSRKESFDEATSTASDSPRSALADESGGNSPPCAPHSSPAVPHGGGMTANGNGGERQSPLMMRAAGVVQKGMHSGERERPAKEHLRAQIRGEDMDDAWAWTCKCIQRHPGALSFQDADGDTLLHIVTSHLDLAKIYALVEQMLKADSADSHGRLLFDLPNRMGETPLMVAVQKGRGEVVDYLLEAGASPNSQSSRMERDMPLHYAASRGMTHIVRILCADPTTALNSQNGMGLTPLLCAIKSHGALEEETQNPVCSLSVLEVLLRAGADPGIANVSNGRTVVHGAVERMDARLVELLRDNVNEQQMTALVNKVDFCGETPMRTLEMMSEGGESGQRAELCLALITCGAKAQ